MPRHVHAPSKADNAGQDDIWKWSDATSHAMWWVASIGY